MDEIKTLRTAEHTRCLIVPCRYGLRDRKAAVDA